MARSTDKLESAATEAYEKSQEFVTKGISSSEKAAESLIEMNAAFFKGGETIGKKLYDNYVSNVAAAFDGVKALNKAGDVNELYKVATSNAAAATERLTEQSKSFVELSGKVMKESGEAARQAYSKGFSLDY